MRDFTEQEKEIIRKAYVDDGRGLAYCASLISTDSNNVKKILKELNIHIRTFSEAVALRNKKQAYIKKDENYFQTQSHNMAWLLGFLASDGHVSQDNNKITINLAIKDKEILEKIKKELSLTTNIKEYITTNGYDACKLQWTCEQHKKELAKYSIIPQKTYLLKPPIALNEEYWIDYIRGYFDGDGSINLIQNSNGRGNGNLRWQVCSTTKEVVEWIQEVLENKYNIPKTNIYSHQRNGKDLWYIQYSSIATRNIYKILYTPGSLYLKRKKDHYEEILAKVKPLYDN